MFFGGSRIGDPAEDFASIMGPYGYGKEFLKWFYHTYPEMEPASNRTQFYARTIRLRWALGCLESGKIDEFMRIIQTYE